MKILLHDYAGHPFPVQLSRKLAARGHQVLHLYAGYNVTPRGNLQKNSADPETFEPRPVYIKVPLDKSNLLRRWLQERRYGRLAASEIREFQPDVVLCANTPLDSLKPILRASHDGGGAFVFWLQDLIGVATYEILSRRVPIVGHAVGLYYRQLEEQLLRDSDAIVAISNDFAPFLRDIGISSDELAVVPNWAPLRQLPTLPKSNAWAQAQGLRDQFRFAYTGTLGMKHNPRLLLELAQAVADGENPAEVLVASEGSGATWLQDRAASAGLRNFRVLGFQPMERYAEVLASADVLVAILEEHAGRYSVPSKVLSYLCAGRPLLLAVPTENLAARIVRENNAGIVVAPDDREGFIRGAKSLLADQSIRTTMAGNARDYAESTFDIEKIADRFETLLQAAIQSTDQV